MKKIYLSLLSAFALATCLTSCEIETSDNGDLDGNWHLTRIDTLATGGINDLSESRLFWAIQAKLIHAVDYDYQNEAFYLRFNQTSDSLIVHTPYLDHWHQDLENGGDIPVADPTPLFPYGINSLEEHFAKEKCDGHHLILKSKTLRLYFTSF